MFAQREGNVVEHREIGEQRAKLEQHAHLPPHGIQVIAVEGGNIGAVEEHLAALRPDLAADQAHHGGLAAAGAAHDSHHLAAREAHAKA